MTARRRHLAVLAALLAACGSRTGLPIGPGVDGSVSRCPAPPPATCADAGNPWVLFEYGSSGEGFAVYAARADGTALHILTLPVAFPYLPSPSPDGTRLLYVAFRSVGGIDDTLHVYDFATHEDRILSTGYPILWPAWSPDGTKAMYQVMGVLHIRGVDDPTDHVVMHGEVGTPRFSCDGARIFYSDSATALGWFELDGTHDTPLIALPGRASNYAVSPDETQALTIVNCGGIPDRQLRVYRYASLPAACASGMPLAARNPGLNLIHAETNDATPTWSTAHLIAFQADGRVYVVPDTGGDARELSAGLDTTGARGAGDPTWMPPCAELP